MIIKFQVYVSTRYVGSKVSVTLELDIDDDATSEEIEKEKEELAKEWLWQNIEFGWD
jgi:divalent metal cation (Fe/Co/Zn/Cd) transporter